MPGNYSIKWKLSASFVALSLGLVSSYIVMAKQTFESDKIYYIFDSEQAQLESLSHDINQQLERTLFDSRSLLAGFDFSTSQLSQLGKNLFQDQKNLLAIEIWDKSSSKSILKLEKIEQILPDITEKKYPIIEERSLVSNSNSSSSSLQIVPLGEQKFIISTSQKTPNGDTLWLRVVAEFSDILPKSPTGHLILSQKDQILEQSGKVRIPANVTQEIIVDLNKDRSEKTSIHEVQKKEYFISSILLKYGDLRLSSVVDKEVALQTLRVLYFRSLVFLVFAVLVTILIALLLSSKLTEQLQVLTERAFKISHGDFSSQVDVRSNDEVGILSRAFSRMSVEIERLLNETKDKARMEQELNTAKIVQENLFPKHATHKNESFELSGLLATSSECSGDWWYYFERGDDLFVFIADATGHGTPAALITSAARSLFSQIEISNSSLKEMATQWDRAIASCSNKTFFMTALLLQVSKVTGVVHVLNASHELPYIIHRSGGAYLCKPVMIPTGPRLGEFLQKDWPEEKFTLEPGDRLVLFTDGLTSIANPAGKELSERRLVKAMQDISEENQAGANQFCTKVYDIFETHREGAALTDDVTLVVLERRSA